MNQVANDDMELRWPRGERVSSTRTSSMDVIEGLIGEGRCLAAARLAVRMMGEAPDIGRRRRYKGLLLFALSRLPEGVQL